MIISTNVAETSLTVDDVTIVIDSGRVKQECRRRSGVCPFSHDSGQAAAQRTALLRLCVLLRDQAGYDELNAASQLTETWAPRSSRRQRRGRAGRTRRGEYWALYTRAQERSTIRRSRT